MVELQHLSTPQDFIDFLKRHPNMKIDDFSHLPDFVHIKSKVIKPSLCDLQYGLCVYCEKVVKLNDGEVEHIRPKSKYPNLCFEYTNYAFACRTTGTCGNKKGNRDLRILPGANCNDKWTIDHRGEVIPVTGLSPTEEKVVRETIDLLGLNVAKLAASRLTVLKAYELVRELGVNCQTYLRNHSLPFQYILPLYYSHSSA